MEIVSNSKPCCTAANHGERSLDRLLHHITQRTGFHHPALTRSQGAFDGQQFAAHLGPGQARHLANLIAFLGQAVLELLHAGIIFQHVRRQGNRSVITALYVLTHHLTADLGNLPLQATHTGFPGVVADQVAQGLFRQLELVLTQAISLDLLGQQVTQGNVDLLVFGVTRNPDDLHTVQQRRRNIHGVGGTHEHHIGKVVIHFQVMVVEGVVLFRVQDLKQGRRRVTPMVHTHLVDFIKQEQRVFHLYLGQLLQQLARQGADVGFAVTTDFRFVTHATQGHAGVFPVGSLGNGLPQRGLAHTGRPYQAQYRPFDLLHPALHRQVLKDAFLDFIQAVVVPVENLARFFQVVANAAALFPGHCQHPVDVAPHYRGFGRHGRHHLQLVQFRFGLLAGFFRQAGLLELLLQLFKIVVTLTQIAHLFLDGLHLFVQVILPLAALHLLLHAATDAFSTSIRSISPSSLPSSRSTRLRTSRASSSSRFSGMRISRCAAMVSTRRSSSLMPVSALDTSEGTFLDSFTNFSNSPIRVLVRTSSSRSGKDSSSIRTAWPVRKSASSMPVMLARALPSTSTLTVPSGNRSICSTVASVPMSNTSFGPGSSVEASFWATRRISLLPSIAASRAWMDFSRPTNSGTTMCGNTTTSRSGSSGYSCTVSSGIRVIGNPLTAFLSAYHPSLGRRQKLQSFYERKARAG